MELISRGRVFICSLRVKISGVKKSFQVPMKERRINVIHAGRTKGITTCQKIIHSDAPSTLAASISSMGTCSMNCFIKNKPYDPAITGNINPAYVSIRPRRSTIR